MQTEKHIYFPGLNALRFFAAMLVVFVHLEQWKGVNGLASGAQKGRFFLGQLGMTGSDAITFFFIISGFLITYLLLAERDRTGMIHIRKFYIRRILRIWPVYYLVMLIAFALVPIVVRLTGYDGYYDSIRHDFIEKFLLYLFFLPNVASIRGFYPVGASHLWTIGIEEQFYLIWPLLLKRFRKTIVPCLIAIIVFKILVILLFYFYFDLRQYAPLRPQGFDLLLIYLLQFRIETMAIGGLAAYIVFMNKQRILSFIFHPIMEKLTLTIMLAHVLFVPAALQGGTAIEQAVVSYGQYILYTLFILNVTCNPNSTLKLEHRVLDYLGRLSYGIYAYHLAIIFLVFVALEKSKLPFQNTFLENLILYIIVSGLTLAAAAASYQWYESAFLRLKSRFAVIKSSSTMDVHAVQTALPLDSR